MLGSLAAALIAVWLPDDPVFSYFRGNWICAIRDAGGATATQNIAFVDDPDVPSLRRISRTIRGDRVSVTSGVLVRRGWRDDYVETGAGARAYWTAVSKGWRGDVLIWTDLPLGGDADRDRLTITRTGADTFDTIDERIDGEGRAITTNQRSSCRRSAGPSSKQP